jgi:hypothetical protein
MSAEEPSARCAKAFGILGTTLAVCDRPYGHWGVHTSAFTSFAGQRDHEDEERTVALIAIHESRKRYEETMDTADELRGDMFWQPVEQAMPIPPQLAVLLARRLWGAQGTRARCKLGMDSPLREYLRGLSDAGVEGAGRLWGAIADHGEIWIWVEPQ